MEQIAFPEFDSEQLDKIAKLSELVAFDTGDELISQGQKNYPFYVIKSGTIRIVERDSDRETQIATHGPGSFSGDVDMLTRRSSLFVAIANEPVEAYRLCGDRLRRLLNECPAVSEVLLEAFQLRRKMIADLPFMGVEMSTPVPSV